MINKKVEKYSEREYFICTLENLVKEKRGKEYVKNSIYNS